MELVTGYKGYEHVTAEQLAELQAGIVGSDGIRLNVGEKMRAAAVNSNTIRIFDGTALVYGRQCTIDPGSHEDILIDNGTPGYRRNDLVVFHYIKDVATGIEDVRLKVLKGVTGQTATDPEANNRNLRDGVTESEIPFVRVRLSGLSIEGIDQLFPVITTNDEAENRIQEMEKSPLLLYHAVCSNGAAVAAKVITVAGLVLRSGVKIAVKFTNGITADNATLNVNNSGAKPIYYKGAALATGHITSGAYVILYYDGSRWNVIGDLSSKQISDFLKAVSDQDKVIKKQDETIANLSKTVEKKQESLLKNSIASAKVKNLNTITTPGYYWLNCDGISFTPKTTGVGWLEVIATESDLRMQRYTERSTGNIYVRTYSNLTWYDWKLETDPIQKSFDKLKTDTEKSLTDMGKDVTKVKDDIVALKDADKKKQDSLMKDAPTGTFNNVTKAGHYWIDPDKTSGWPIKKFGILEVSCPSNALAVQRFTTWDDIEVYVRLWVGGAWSAWRKI